MPRRIFLAIVLALSVRKEGGGVSRSIKPNWRGADILTTQFLSTSEMLMEIS
jgi:hypothetical protein